MAQRAFKHLECCCLRISALHSLDHYLSESSSTQLLEEQSGQGAEAAKADIQNAAPGKCHGAGSDFCFLLMQLSP